MNEVVLIPGDGIGVEITKSVKTILDAAGADLNWIECKAGLSAYEELGTPLPEETLNAIDKHITYSTYIRISKLHVNPTSSVMVNE